jgi:hypothetical protein
MKQVAYLTLFFLFACTLFASPDRLDQAIDIEKKQNDAAGRSQQRVDTLDAKRARLLEAYKAQSAKLDSARVYNEQLEEMIQSQQEELASLKRQLGGIDRTAREILPLMKEMVAVLEQFITLDTPFLLEERQERIGKLKERMRLSSISVSEKYRMIMEAYTIENEYARTIEAYRGKLGDGRVVDFLRLGRVALYYQTLDLEGCGIWDTKKGQWHELDSSHSEAIRKGLKIAKKQAAPALLELVVPTPGGEE